MIRNIIIRINSNIVQLEFSLIKSYTSHMQTNPENKKIIISVSLKIEEIYSNLYSSKTNIFFKINFNTNL